MKKRNATESSCVNIGAGEVTSGCKITTYLAMEKKRELEM